MKQIINKVAYWGSHTFVATADKHEGKDIIRIDVYRNLPKIHENFYFVENKEQILEMSLDEKCSLRFYTGDLSRNHRKTKDIQRKNKNGRMVSEKEAFYTLGIDEFIEAFKYNID